MKEINLKYFSLLLTFTAFIKDTSKNNQMHFTFAESKKDFLKLLNRYEDYLIFPYMQFNQILQPSILKNTISAYLLLNNVLFPNIIKNGFSNNQSYFSRVLIK